MAADKTQPIIVLIDIKTLLVTPKNTVHNEFTRTIHVIYHNNVGIVLKWTLWFSDLNQSICNIGTITNFYEISMKCKFKIDKLLRKLHYRTEFHLHAKCLFLAQY